MRRAQSRRVARDELGVSPLDLDELPRSVRGGVALPEERILLSERQEDSSILGAAVLPIYDLLSPRFEVLQQDRRVETDLADLMGQRAITRAGRL